ncbi:MAG: transposase [Dehalococcoidia bacterium]|nr:transposase [Dehalococcoidia bacterium]
MEREFPTRGPDLGSRRMSLRLQGFDYCDPNRIYFATVCARHLTAPFLNSSLAGAVTEAILHRIDYGEWRVYACCLMPDQLHLAPSPVPGRGNIPHLLQGFKNYTTRLAWRHELQGVLWQRSMTMSPVEKKMPQLSAGTSWTILCAED